MRGRVSKRASLLVVLAMASSWVGGTLGAHAAVANDPTWIQQAGNGSGSSTPVIQNFNLRTVLYDPQSFPFRNGFSRVNSTRYYAWGTISAGDQDPRGLLARVAVSQSNDGLRWSAPVPATIKDTSAPQDVPFLVSDTEEFDVVFVPSRIGADPLPSQTDSATGSKDFAIYYRKAGNTNISDINSWRVATSADGFTFGDELAVKQDATAPVIGGGFKSSSYGPSQVIFQPSGSTTNSCGATNPWSCKFVMAYDATGPVSPGAPTTENVGLAGSGDGITFSALSTPLLAAGSTGAWDDDSATLASIQRTTLAGGASGFSLYYSGWQGPDNACYGGDAGCASLGTATSTDGLNFAKAAQNPVTPHALLEMVTPTSGTVSASNQTVANRSTLWNPIPVNTGQTDHTPVYFTRITNGSPRKDVYIAFTGPAPDGAVATEAGKPSIHIASPAGSRKTTATPIDVYLNDTFGTLIGIKPSTVTIGLDPTLANPGGTPLSGWSLERTIVDGYYHEGYRLTADGNANQLDDGAHTLIVSVTDNDGNVNTATSAFSIDVSAPVTTLTGTPAAQQTHAIPTDSLGRFVGTVVSGNGLEDNSSLTCPGDPACPAGAKMEWLKMVVTNPIGQQSVYTIKPSPNNQTITPVTSRKWNFSWVHPVADPNALLPGNYTVSILGVDAAKNIEAPSAANTFAIVVI